MEKIKAYIDRFGKRNINRNYSLTSEELIMFMNEVRHVDRLFHTIAALFNYGYIKGYRACKAEQKKAGKTA